MKKILSALAVLSMAASAAPASAATLINTTQPFSSSIGPFGNPDTSAYGQTFTVGSDNVLNSFSLYLTGAVQNPVDFRAYVYAWNGSSASGPQLYQSALQSFTGSLANSPTEFSFNTGNLTLSSGSKYVAFLFADFVGAPSVAATPISGSGGSNPYAGGEYVFYNAGNNFASLTSSQWQCIGCYGDIWFKAALSTDASAAAVPEPATWAMMLVGFGAVGFAMRRRQRQVVRYHLG